jgi:hypothetical protein
MAMEKHLKGSGLFDLDTELKTDKKELKISFSDRE